ncbi:hypothetical protein RugamoR57_46430 [Duganella caerulea]|uniref:BrnT family toxin n=1 Tax=Duganella caerulea TaxID=2885762 RepID=UPI0030E841E7
MVITFDPKKDKLNQRKHGISLSAASAFDWDNAVIWIDQRYHYSEVRECAIGLIGHRLFQVTFVDRGRERRIISLRKANGGEEISYVGQK